MQGEMTIPMLQEYPFMACKEAANNKATTFVKKVIQYGPDTRFSIKQKLRMVKNLGFQGFIGLEKTVEEENTLSLMFECIPFKFQEQVIDMDEERVERVKNMMYDMADNLVNHCVQHQFKVRNIGLDRRNGLKYFLGLNFNIDKAMRKQDTLQRYRRIIDYFFARGGPVIRGKSPSNSLRNECRQTQDTSYKLSYSEEPNHLFVPASTNIMKKSATVPEDKIIFANEPRHIQSRYTFNCQNALNIPTEDRKNYVEEKQVETKFIKIDELGSRINKLKSYIKQISGRTPTSSGGLARLTVHVDANNSENRIFQENKIMITPSYTKLEKKIAQFRQSKLYRAYNEKEILYSKNNQGYQVHTTQKLQDNRQVIMDSIQTEPTKTNYQRVNHVPNYLLQKNQITSKKPIQSPKNQLTHVPSAGSTPNFNDSKHYNAFHNSGRQQSMNSSKALISDPDNPQEKQYRMLATKDKYCEQFMFFLEDEEQAAALEPCSPFGSIRNIPQIEPKAKPENLSKSLNNNQIQDRVKKAIRNSIKLINDLKTKQTTA